MEEMLKLIISRLDDLEQEQKEIRRKIDGLDDKMIIQNENDIKTVDLLENKIDHVLIDTNFLVKKATSVR